MLLSAVLSAQPSEGPGDPPEATGVNELFSEEATTVAALRAVQWVWQSVPLPPRRLFTRLGNPQIQWREAWERGWIDLALGTDAPLDRTAVQALLERAQDPAAVWEPLVPPSWRPLLESELGLEVGPPRSERWSFAGAHQAGFALADEEGDYLRVKLGVLHLNNDLGASGFFLHTEDLWWEGRVRNPLAWFHDLRFRVGRFLHEGGLLYRQTLDGLRLSLGGRGWTLHAQSGYSGLIHREAGLPLVTPGDLTDFSHPDNPWGPPRLLSALSLELWGAERHPFRATVVLHQDLRDRITPQRLLSAGATQYTPAEGGLYQGIGLSLEAEIPLGSFLLLAKTAYQGGTTLHYSQAHQRYQDYFFHAGAFLLEVPLNLPLPKAQWWVRTWGSSGDGDYRQDFQEGSRIGGEPWFLLQYRSWGYPSPLQVLRLEWGNLWGVGVAAQLPLPFLPTDQLRLESHLAAAFRLTTGAVSDPSVQVGPNASRFLGAEAYSQAVWEPWAELRLLLGLGGAFLVTQGAFPEEWDSWRGHLRLSVRISL